MAEVHTDPTPRDPLGLAPPRAEPAPGPLVLEPPVDPRTPSPAGAPSRRFASLDVFRGMAVIGMILVNNPGDPSRQFPCLAHAPWDGLTLADLVFPFFLVSAGISLTFMLGGRQAPGEKFGLTERLVRRCAILIGLGLLFHWLVSLHSPSFRIPGVLQRIGVCSLLGGLLLLYSSWKAVAWALGGLLAGYTALLLGVHAPSFLDLDARSGIPHEVPYADVSPGRAPDFLSSEGSLPSWVDRQLMGPHLYRPQYDPEGLLSTVASLATVLMGILAGFFIRSGRTRKSRLWGLLGAGLLLVGLGVLSSRLLPLNKSLWTPPFTLVTGGIALLVIAGIGAGVEGRPGPLWARPFEVFGANAFLAYIASNFLTLLLGSLVVGEKTLGGWLFEGVFLPWTAGGIACLGYALLQVLFWLPLLWVLKRKGLHFRI